MATSSTMDRRDADRSLFDKVFRNPDTGELAVIQVPNLPLIVFLVATAVRMAFHPHGTAGTAVSVVSAVALGIWSIDEIARGDSLFRRILGGVVLVTMVVGLLTR
jgi:hypothetical protein